MSWTNESSNKIGGNQPDEANNSRHGDSRSDGNASYGKDLMSSSPYRHTQMASFNFAQGQDVQGACCPL
jgi:hypothetical protein